MINYVLVGPGERYNGTDPIVIHFWDERRASDESLPWQRLIGLLEVGEDAPVVRAHPLFIELGVGHLVVIKHGIHVRHPLLNLLEHLVHGHLLTKYVERPAGQAAVHSSTHSVARSQLLRTLLSGRSSRAS